MSKYQLDLVNLLKKETNLKDWKIRTSGGDILIRVPQTTDMKKLEEVFPTLIAEIIPSLSTDKTSLKFYVGQSESSDFVYILH